MRALILSTHIVGVLILFSALALESVGLRQLRRSNDVGEAGPWLTLFSLVLRLYPTALAVLLLTGAYLATNVGVWQFGWVRLSMATLVIVTIVGIFSAVRVRALYRYWLSGAETGGLVGYHLRSHWLPALLSARAAAVLGIIYVMVGKPDFVPSLIIVTTAALAGAIATSLTWRWTKVTAGVSWSADDNDLAAAARRQQV